jgi:hypothetical protein
MNVAIMDGSVRVRVKRPCAGGRLRFGCDAQWGRTDERTGKSGRYCGRFNRWLRTSRNGEVRPCAACLAAERRAKGAK